MADWPSLFRRPDDLDGWFPRIAGRLLNGSHLWVGRRPYLFAEIEFYYWSEAHPDPFTHRDPIQYRPGRWYFHRTRGVLRGGSFKGLDLTFGSDEASGGILIRGLVTPEGTLVDGPSLCVDHLLDATGAETVAELDRAANERLAWEDGNPLRLQEADGLEERPLVRSPRVGLLLKRVRSRDDATRFVMRSYRYLAEPRRTKKGKPHMVLALHARGADADEVQRVTGCPRRTAERYAADFEAGRGEADFEPYFGKDLGPSEWCRLYGAWWAHFGESE